MTESSLPLDAETLTRNRQHFGNEPHFFWIAFSSAEEPQLFSVSQVWQAARDGRRPSFFRYAPLMASERQMLRFVANLEAGVQ